MTPSLFLSVVIPAYNEAARFPPYLGEIATFLGKRGQPYEVLVVDDGSTDQTAEVVEGLRRTDSALRLIRLEANHGKGYAVRAGIRQARGALILVADADGAAPIAELQRLEQAVARGADLAIGSRFLASHHPRYHVKARWHRTMLGNLFNGVVQRVGIPGISDTQCGFKLFRAGVALDLFGLATIDGYGFDLEVLFLAQRRGYRIAEVPINWSDQPGTKVRVLPDGLRMLRELFTVRRNFARGRYLTQPPPALAAKPLPEK